MRVHDHFIKEKVIGKIKKVLIYIDMLRKFFSINYNWNVLFGFGIVFAMKPINIVDDSFNCQYKCIEFKINFFNLLLNGILPVKYKKLEKKYRAPIF